MDFSKKIVELISKVTEQKKELFENTLEMPKDKSLGDYAFPCFALSRQLKKNPVMIAQEITEKLGALKKETDFLEDIINVNAYVNFKIKKDLLAKEILEKINYPFIVNKKINEIIGVESPSPNTNKPLHLGHARNMLIGQSIRNILQKTGRKTIAFDLVNDKGVHICKSMLAYELQGKDKTPSSEKIKPDHFVGKYYVLFNELIKKEPELEEQAKKMLIKWEQNDKKTIDLWKKMRDWCIKGIKKTYDDYEIKIDQADYESEIYLEGKKIVELGLKKGVFQQEKDGAIYADLTNVGLDKKYLQRNDGTSIYITQDLYLAKKRFDEYKLDKLIYIVGSEQIYHFKTLFELFKLLGFDFANKCHHVAYGMIYLPSGKMKSREGTIVDADNLREEMLQLSEVELKKRYPNINKKELDQRKKIIGLGALKFFILKFDSTKDFVYDPNKSLSFQGESGPYVQYAYARIKSIIRKSEIDPEKIKPNYALLEHELERLLILKIEEYEQTIIQASNNYKPSIIANYLLELAQLFNSYYHEVPILEQKTETKKAKLYLVNKTSIILKDGLETLGIQVLEEM